MFSPDLEIRDHVLVENIDVALEHHQLPAAADLVVGRAPLRDPGLEPGPVDEAVEGLRDVPVRTRERIGLCFL